MAEDREIPTVANGHGTTQDGFHLVRVMRMLVDDHVYERATLAQEVAGQMSVDTGQHIVVAHVSIPLDSALPLKHIPLDPFDRGGGISSIDGKTYPPCQRSAGSQDNRIDADKHYLAKIHGGWYLGQFDLMWYGWSFDGWANPSYQLDSIEDLYEVDLGSLDG